MRSSQEQIELACLMEATARKPGNVHPGFAFADLCFDDFVHAARAIAQPLSAVRKVGLGQAVLDAVQATRAATGTNVNLGIVLLFAPLAAVPQDVPLSLGIKEVLNQTTLDDAENVFAAIRLAQPGGMGKVKSQDVSERPTINLKQAMTLAMDRDRIAEQYATDFRLVFEAQQKLCELITRSKDWESAIVWLQIWMMSKWPDTLIARKCGKEVAQQASSRAVQLIEWVELSGTFDEMRLAEFDQWLRADGHRRNPGTTADLIAAALYATLRDGFFSGLSIADVMQFASQISNRSDFRPGST